MSAALLEQLRLGLKEQATPHERQLALAAGHELLRTLEPPAVRPTLDPQQLALLVRALRGVPLERVLDIAIAKLQAALPAGAVVPTANGTKFPLVPLPVIQR